MENILNVQSEEIKKLKSELKKDQDLIRILNTLKAEQETLTAMSDETNRKTHLVLASEITRLKDKLSEAESRLKRRDQTVSELKKKVKNQKGTEESLKSTIKDLRHELDQLKVKENCPDKSERFKIKNVSKQQVSETNEVVSKQIVRLSRYIEALKQTLESASPESQPRTNSSTPTDSDSGLPIQREQVKLYKIRDCQKPICISGFELLYLGMQKCTIGVSFL